jgi:hypothetical protein
MTRECVVVPIGNRLAKERERIRAECLRLTIEILERREKPCMTEQNLPPCRLRTFQKISTKATEFSVEETNRSVFCTRLDHWVSISTCQGCRCRPLRADEKLERALGHMPRREMNGKMARESRALTTESMPVKHLPKKPGANGGSESSCRYPTSRSPLSKMREFTCWSWVK